MRNIDGIEIQVLDSEGKKPGEVHIHRCQMCRRIEGLLCRAPPPPPLPVFRVKKSPPFTRFRWTLVCERVKWECQGVDMPLHLLCSACNSFGYCSQHVYTNIHLFSEKFCGKKRSASHDSFRQREDV